jgi:hypothetical protein
VTSRPILSGSRYSKDFNKELYGILVVNTGNSLGHDVRCTGFFFLLFTSEIISRIVRIILQTILFDRVMYFILLNRRHTGFDLGYNFGAG